MAKGGRPTQYGEHILLKAEEYLENYSLNGDIVPQVAGLALFLGVHRETLYAWSKEEGKEAFSDIFEKVKAAQENKLINGGLNGDYNPAITKMMLTKHGYSDKIESQVEEKGVKTIIVRGDDAKL
jgi:hypothetical protein